MNVQHEYVFFTDRDLGKQFPDILGEAGIRVKRHSNYFADDIKDEEWSKEIGKRQWYVLTHDRRIRYKQNEIAAIKKYKIALFVIVGKAPFAELAHNFVVTFRKIIRFIDYHSPPFIAKVYRPDSSKKKGKTQLSGEVKMWVSFIE